VCINDVCDAGPSGQAIYKTRCSKEAKENRRPAKLTNRNLALLPDTNFLVILVSRRMNYIDRQIEFSAGTEANFLNFPLIALDKNGF